jgi:hypothetical protein
MIGSRRGGGRYERMRDCRRGTAGVGDVSFKRRLDLPCIVISKEPIYLFLKNEDITYQTSSSTPYAIKSSSGTGLVTRCFSKSQQKSWYKLTFNLVFPDIDIGRRRHRVRGEVVNHPASRNRNFVVVSISGRGQNYIDGASGL